MKKGSVTVYMTWMLAVLLSLFVTVIEGARQRAISIQAETAVDLAVYSVFAEYNRALFDAYDLLFIDTSYGEKTGSLARAKKHFSYYANENLMQGQTAATADLTKCFCRMFLFRRMRMQRIRRELFLKNRRSGIWSRNMGCPMWRS